MVGATPSALLAILLRVPRQQLYEMTLATLGVWELVHHRRQIGDVYSRATLLAHYSSTRKIFAAYRRVDARSTTKVKDFIHNENYVILHNANENYFMKGHVSRREIFCVRNPPCHAPGGW